MATEACLYKFKKYGGGEQVCEQTRCFICKDGNWQERFMDRVFGVGP